MHLKNVGSHKSVFIQLIGGLFVVFQNAWNCEHFNMSLLWIKSPWHGIISSAYTKNEYNWNSTMDKKSNYLSISIRHCCRAFLLRFWLNWYILFFLFRCLSPLFIYSILNKVNTIKWIIFIFTSNFSEVNVSVDWKMELVREKKRQRQIYAIYLSSTRLFPLAAHRHLKEIARQIKGREVKGDNEWGR